MPALCLVAFPEKSEVMERWLQGTSYAYGL